MPALWCGPSALLVSEVMDTVLQGLPKTICYLDDILVTGSTDEEQLRNVEAVLQRLQQYGIRAKKPKCSFFADSVEYLGHKVDSVGLHTTTKKVEAIIQAPEPKDTTEFHSFLGLLHYYGKILPDLATLLHPLNHLLKADTPWAWTAECKQAFDSAKQLLSSAPVLANPHTGL